MSVHRSSSRQPSLFKSSRRRDAQQPLIHNHQTDRVCLRSSHQVAALAVIKQETLGDCVFCQAGPTFNCVALYCRLPVFHFKVAVVPPPATRGAAYTYQVLTGGASGCISKMSGQHISQLANINGLLSLYSYCDKVLNTFQIFTSWFSSSAGEKTS